MTELEIIEAKLADLRAIVEAQHGIIACLANVLTESGHLDPETLRREIGKVWERAGDGPVADRLGQFSSALAKRRDRPLGDGPPG